MKLGIIGSGIIVQEFLPKLVSMEGMEVAAIQGVPSAREQVESLCAANGVPHAVYSFEELAALGIDTSGTLVLRYPGFFATCTAAKDCAAPYSFVIEGTDGYLSTQYPPNLIGQVKLHFNDGSEEIYDDHMAMERLLPEFRYFIDCIGRKDLASCMERLDESVAVSAVQTKARLAAGIVFAADRP